MRLHRLTECSLAVLMAAALVNIAVAGADEEEHFLQYSEYNFAVNFVSGNLTATLTPATIAPRDWPRVIFHHTTDIMSPVFDVGIPTIYLFNDTNDDGVFSRSEATHIAYMSSMYNVTWNATAVEFDNDTVGGEFAWVRANAVIGLFDSPEDEYPMIDQWANVTFWFRISQKSVTRTNSYGDYIVQGMVDVRINFEIKMLERVNSTGIVVEQRLSAGGAADMFMIRENVGQPTPQLTLADSRVDETVNGDNYTHELRKTQLPCQDVLFAKEDGTVQAHYRVSSSPMVSNGSATSQVPMNISYYTVGDGMIVHTAFFPADQNSTISQEIVVGIDETGFTPKFRDWLKDNIALVMVVTGSIVAAVSISVMILMLRRHYGWGKKASNVDEPKKDH